MDVGVFLASLRNTLDIFVLCVQNGQYLGYLKEQEEIYEQRVARRMAVAGIADRRPAPVS